MQPSSTSAVPDVHETSTALDIDVTTDDEPSISEALSSSISSQWVKAFHEEFDTIQAAGTYKKRDQNGMHSRPIPSGVILRVKRNENGDVARLKARLVARGNLQTKSHSSYASLYAPVASFDLVRLLLTLSVQFGWYRYQLDVKGAFLYADLPSGTEVYLRLPTIAGVKQADGSVVRLIKSLYGLREAPNVWYASLKNILSTLGFERLTCSERLFVLKRKAETVILLAYVDDLALFGEKKLIAWVKQRLMERLQITDLGVGKQFLGVTIVENEFMLTQRTLTEKIFNSTGMQSFKPTRVPLPLNHVLYEARKELSPKERSEMETVPYRNIVGALLHLSTRTRPDLCTAVSMLGKFAACPAQQYWKAMKHFYCT